MQAKKPNKILGIIPARYGSTRLPGKPLKDICGHPMIWWVYKRVQNTVGISELYVATDDKRVFDCCEAHKIPVIMTSSKHKTAEDRIYEVAQTKDADFYIQINGDEPLMEKNVVEAAIPKILPKDKEFGTNVITEINNPAQLMDPTNIKVIFDENMDAVYMSRTPVPYPYKSMNFTYYKHVGVIGYNRAMIEFYHSSVPGFLEKTEGIDLLRFIDYKKQLHLSIVRNCSTLSVDTNKDLEYVSNIIKNKMGKGEFDMGMTAVIPVRGGSRRLRNKNILPFAGSNILVHKIRQLKQVEGIDEIVVTSDSNTMLEMAASQGVKTHKRAVEYCDEKTKSFGEVVEYVCREISGDHVAWALATAPLIAPKTYGECITAYYKGLESGFDSLITVEEFHRYLLDKNGPVNFEMGVKHKPSQELEPLYFIGGLTIAPKNKMIEWKYIYGPNPTKYILNKRMSLDIDDELDYVCAKAWLDMDDSLMSTDTYR